MARHLLQAGADMNATSVTLMSYELIPSPGRSTPLHAAAHSGALDVALAILQYYAENVAGTSPHSDPRRKTNLDNLLPHQVALNSGHTMVAELLHPAGNLQSLFEMEPSLQRGVPRLSKLVGDAVKQQLLVDIDFVELMARAFAKQYPEAASGPPVCVSEEASEEATPVYRLPSATAQECCPVRAPNAFVSKAAGYVDSRFVHRPLQAVVQCSVCLDDVFCSAIQPCHHRLCTTCARDLVSRSRQMPLPCPVCRLVVAQFSTTVCL